MNNSLIEFYNIFRFPIAIKSPNFGNVDGIEQCLDEAKTMLEIDSYHDHIVNLQGVTYNWNSIDGIFSEVRVLLI